MSINNNLSEFIENKEKEILELAKQNAEQIARTELALMDFEILLAINFPKEERERITKEARSIRSETWANLHHRANGDFQKIQQLLEKEF